MTKIKNIAIIAHVDHGKTTLVDALLKQSGTFRENQAVAERVMDSGDLERERGITITAKNTAIHYQGIKINIIDTPGHADFGGEVERGMNLVDGAILLVDASEGPLPQTRFVVKKALNRNLPIIVVINKIDRSDARIEEVINEIYDLFIDLDASNEQIEFKILYTIGKQGVAHYELDDDSTNLKPLFDTIINEIPGPIADDNQIPQFLVTNLDYDPYVGQVAVGRLENGTFSMNTLYSLCGEYEIKNNVKFSALYSFDGLKRTQYQTVEAGDIIAIAGVEGIQIGDTISSNDDPKPLPRIKIDEPTVSMIFYVNDSPFAGRDGKFLTSRHIKARLEKEILGNVSLKLKLFDRTDAFEMCGRGELQMAVLIETMRREGYEFMVSKPNVITKKENGITYEPYERVFIDVPEEFVGTVTEKLMKRKGRMEALNNNGYGRASMEFVIPSRGLIGFRSQFLTDTKGSGIMNTLFEDYYEWAGVIPDRQNGALIADRAGKVTGYAALGMEDRGELFVEPGTEVYEGMVVGERNKTIDMNVNITKEKKLTNMRASSSDATVVLRTAKKLSLDQAIEYIGDDELIEVTPNFFRIRKKELSQITRKKLNRDSENE